MASIQNLLSHVSAEMFFLMVLGVCVGIIGGALPGISSTTTVALCATFAYTMDFHNAIMFLCATQVGSTYGGSISASILNIPGTPASAATALEAYPMAKDGRGRQALAINAMASFWGNTIGAILLLLIMPFAISLSLAFGSWEYFWFSMFGLVICAQLSRGDFLKGLFSACFGLLVSFVGSDPIYGAGALRFTYGIRYLKDGIGLIPAMVGLYGMSEVFTSLVDYNAKTVPLRDSKLFAFQELWERKWIALRVSVIGFVIGVIPGVGSNIASWVGYNQAYSTSKHKQAFGHGSIDGLVGSEAANNACAPGTYAPLLALGIPGDGVTAIILSILTVQGIQTGANFMSNNPDFIYLLVAGLLIAGVLFLLIGTVTGRMICRVLEAPLPVIMSVVICLCAIGAYSNSNRYGDIVIMFLFGIIGLVLRRWAVPSAPLVLGIVVGGGLVDANFRRAFMAGKSSLLPFVTRPISLLLVVVLVLMIGKEFFWPALKARKAKAL
ncbi:MAG: tripartite tricarboxylate transporter permease [Anaerotruncus sp.]|nr:tripartite tricarboxylate transporter permease [Anaerotruncus sp.]